MVAMAVLLAVTAGAFGAVQITPDAALVQSELSDMQQRMRIAVDAILRDGIGATSVRPCRWGGPSEDPPGTFRTDTITFASAVGTRTYWLKTDAPSATYQLTSWSGGASADVPVVDNVVSLAFAYVGDGGMPLGPADLQLLRAITITLRVQAAAPAVRGPAGPSFLHPGTARLAQRWAPDVEAQFQLSPRNLNLER